MAAKPPTRMYSTSWRDRTFRISMNLGTEAIPEHHDAFDKVLRRFDALSRRKAEHPEDDVVVIPFPDVWLQVLGLAARDRFLFGTSGVGWVAHASMVAGLALLRMAGDVQ